jgi:hypothetical protein
MAKNIGISFISRFLILFKESSSKNKSSQIEKKKETIKVRISL